MATHLRRRDLFLAGAALALSSTSARAHNGVIHVMIEGLAFKPADVTAKVGERIEWTNHDPFDHTATVRGGWEVLIPAGQKATHTITAEDGVEYFCRFHPTMKGHVRIMK